MAPPYHKILLLIALSAAFGTVVQAGSTGPPCANATGAFRLDAAWVEGEPDINGRLDETVWSTAGVAADFCQFEPEEGVPASQRTEVRVLYGAHAVYVGAVLFDTAPDQIERALGRRDEYNLADWFLVSIDSYYDRRTAYTFGVNAAGVQFDAIRQAEGSGPGGGPPGGPGGGGGPEGMDPSWDAIWSSSVRVTSEGWVAEMRIPYTMLRFPELESQTWGIHFTRRIPRLGEQSEWPLVPRTERSNLIARFGQLVGIEGVKPGRNVQLRPYTVSRLHTRESEEAPGTAVRSGDLDLGADIKIGLGTNVTLDATVNPDFGQVESDPAVLNLTAFETIYEERRPFFVEGAQIFNFSAGPGQLLYTRRIGADSPILGAGKLSGRTASGLSFGLLAATTGDDFDPTDVVGVARLSKQIGAYSSVGGVLTAFDGVPGDKPDRVRSAVTGVDWDVRLGGNRYGLEGFAAATFRTAEGDASLSDTGIAGKVWARKRQGRWTGMIGLDVFGDGFNPNDVGQLRENNFIANLNSVEHELNGGRPFGPFLRASAEAMIIQKWSYDEGLDLGKQLDAGLRWMMRGFQQFEIELSVDNPFGGYDLYETRGLGPFKRPAFFELQGEVRSDDRRPWHIEPEVLFSGQDGGGRKYGVGLRGDWIVSSRLLVEGNVEHEWETSWLAWASNELFVRDGPGVWRIGREAGDPETVDTEDLVALDDGGLLDNLLSGVEPVLADRYLVSLFGARDTRALDFTLRSSVTFTPHLSLQLYSQLFLARGRYDDFEILRNRDEPAPFGAFPKRNDFSLNSLVSNVVLRWEYRPGSALFVVWTHGRNAEDELNPLAPWGRSPYDRPIDKHLADTFRIFPENVFLVKLNYAFLR